MTRSVVASAPGSIMVTGEHAVVYGHPAIVAAIDQRMDVSISERPDRSVSIASEIAQDATFNIDDLPEGGPYRFVLQCVAAFAPLPHGLDIKISSKIDPTLGLGSSAAVTIATLGGLAKLLTRSIDVHATALSIVRKIQGRGSGADLAASLNGGVIAYSIPTDVGGATINALPQPPTLSLCYTGYKTPTGEVLSKVVEAWTGRDDDLAELYKNMGGSAQRAISAAQADDWELAAPDLNAYQSLMETLGVSDPVIDRIVAAARATEGALAAKISGSGLGDCVLALGAVPEGFTQALVAGEGLIADDA